MAQGEYVPMVGPKITVIGEYQYTPIPPPAVHFSMLQLQFRPYDHMDLCRCPDCKPPFDPKWNAIKPRIVQLEFDTPNMDWDRIITQFKERHPDA